jgi:hypothetical protein
MWKYDRAREDTDDDMIRLMRITCWITKVTDHTECIIIIALPRQQWLSERASLLGVYVHRLSFFFNNQPDAPIIQIYSVIKLYIFRTTSLPIIRSFLLYIRHW